MWDPKMGPWGGTLGWDPNVAAYGDTLRWDPGVGPEGELFFVSFKKLRIILV